MTLGCTSSISTPWLDVVVVLKTWWKRGEIDVRCGVVCGIVVMCTKKKQKYIQNDNKNCTELVGCVTRPLRVE